MTFLILEELCKNTNQAHAELDTKRAGLYRKLMQLDEERKELQAEIAYIKESMQRVGKAFEALTGKNLSDPDVPILAIDPDPLDDLGDTDLLVEEVKNFSGLR